MTFQPKLTPEQVEELVLDWKNGCSVNELTIIYRVSTRTVYRHLAKLDVKYRHRPNKPRKKQKPKEKPELQPCGTNAAYARHIKHGEVPCDACRAAHAADVAKYRPEKPKVKRKRHGTKAAYQRHLYNKEEPCFKCKVASARAKQRYRARRKKRKS